MEEQIFKSGNPEELIVFCASSLKNEIRFYLNHTKYVVAVECEGGCRVEVKEEKTEEIQQKRRISLIKENLREFIKLFFILLGISAIGFASVFYLWEILNNILIFLIVMNIVYFVINIVNVVIMETMETDPAIKSKHSAEHMMVNFLEKNKRLPKNIEEIRKSSRFSPDCGSRRLIKGIAEELIQSTIATIITVFASSIASDLYYDSTVNIIIFLVIYYLTKFIVGKAITKYGMLKFIINPIKRVLTKITQCANTTNKVKDEDIFLAYSAAKQWLQTVYPQFYNKDEDIFEKKYFKVIN